MANVQEAVSPAFDLERRDQGVGARLTHHWFVWKRKPAGLIGGLLILFFVIIAVAAPLAAPFPAGSLVGEGLESPNSTHLFGTDNIGRDTLSRTVYGAQISLAAGLTAATIATIAGTSFAILGYFGSWVDALTQRLLEILSSFPSIVLALVFIVILGRANATSTNFPTVIWQLRSLELAIGLTFIFSVTRVIRSSVIRERSLPYIEAARSIGAPTSRILWRHILPNIMPYVIVTFSSLIGTTILIESSLSFLGYGVAPGTPSWGSDLSTRNRDYFWSAPWLLLAPGIALTLLVTAYNFFGDALRDILDPRLRGS